MKVIFSKFLESKKDSLKKLIKILSKDFKYVSILGTDCNGKSYYINKFGTTLSDSPWNERGFVIRVFNGINYSEYSFNELKDDNIEYLAEFIKDKLNSQIKTLKDSSSTLSSYPIIEEEQIKNSFIGSIDSINKEINDKIILQKMNRIMDEGLSLSSNVVNIRIYLGTTHVNKIFLSNKKELTQSYVWSEGSIFSIAKNDSKTKFAYDTFSGLKGIELLDEMKTKIKNIVKTSENLLDAKSIIPGEYDVICSPNVSGIIAHEAFGHGVEMDMFVKNRAKATDYIDKKVASPLVTMHDGATSYKEQVSSYLFDDEGTLGQDTIIIDKGILKNGMCDALSALNLGISPTGNGKRESFERKAYARMTNTFFEKRNDKLEDMISSIKYGFLLDSPTSGMEDPKNWGIQLMINIAYEIKNGKLTGNLFSPIVVTGYVPDVLNSISMVSNDFSLEGSGACGKGYKEYVKVSSGGPYIKAKVRLG